MKLKKAKKSIQKRQILVLNAVKTKNYYLLSNQFKKSILSPGVSNEQNTLNQTVLNARNFLKALCKFHKTNRRIWFVNPPSKLKEIIKHTKNHICFSENLKNFNQSRQLISPDFVVAFGIKLNLDAHKFCNFWSKAKVPVCVVDDESSSFVKNPYIFFREDKKEAGGRFEESFYANMIGEVMKLPVVLTIAEVAKLRQERGRLVS